MLTSGSSYLHDIGQNECFNRVFNCYIESINLILVARAFIYPPTKLHSMPPTVHYIK